MTKVEELETTNPDEQEQNSEEVENETTPSNDPLDDIQDEDARAEAKKQRAIAQRNKGKKEEEPKVETTEAKDTEYVTKADMAKLATSEAKGLASDEIKENWDELIEIPLSGFDKLDPKSIVKNMEERLAILKARKPVEEDPDIREITETKVIQGTGVGKKTDKTINPLDKKIKLPAKPEEWYS